MAGGGVWWDMLLDDAERMTVEVVLAAAAGLSALAQETPEPTEREKVLAAIAGTAAMSGTCTYSARTPVVSRRKRRTCSPSAAAAAVDVNSPVRY